VPYLYYLKNRGAEIVHVSRARDRGPPIPSAAGNCIMKRIAVVSVFALVCANSIALAEPTLNMEYPDWGNTRVEDRDLGHGVHMLEGFGGNISVLAVERGILLVDAKT